MCPPVDSLTAAFILSSRALKLILTTVPLTLYRTCDQ